MRRVHGRPRWGASRPSEVEAGGIWSERAGRGGWGEGGGVGELYGALRGDSGFPGTSRSFLGRWLVHLILVLEFLAVHSFPVTKDHSGSSRRLYFLCLSLESCFRQIRGVPQPLIPSLELGDARKRIGPESQGEQESRETDWDLPLLLCSILWRPLERTLK